MNGYVKHFFYALTYGYTLSFIGMGILWLSGKWLVAQFDANIDVIAYGTTYIYVMLFLFCGYVTHFACVATLQGIKKPTMIFYIGFFRQILAPSIVYTLIGELFSTFICLDVGGTWVHCVQLRTCSFVLHLFKIKNTLNVYM